MVKIRLLRMGRKKRPFYRVVVADSRVKRDGKYIDLVGTYNPLANDENEIFKVDEEKVKDWLQKGAQPTRTVMAFLRKKGIIEPLKIENN